MDAVSTQSMFLKRVETPGPRLAANSEKENFAMIKASLVGINTMQAKNATCYRYSFSVSSDTHKEKTKHRTLGSIHSR